MARVHLVTPEDVERLKAYVDRDPGYGHLGSSGAVLSQQERGAHEEAHRFYNLQIRRWLNEVTG